jgi:hypothetical protein
MATNPVRYLPLQPGLFEAVKRLNHSADFRLLVQVLAQRRTKLTDALVTSDDDARAQAVQQGRARELIDLLTYLENPPAQP